MFIYRKISFKIKQSLRRSGPLQCKWVPVASVAGLLLGALVTGLCCENHANNSIWRDRLAHPNIMQSLARALHVVSIDARRGSVVCEPVSVFKYADTTNRQKIELQWDCDNRFKVRKKKVADHMAKCPLLDDRCRDQCNNLDSNLKKIKNGRKSVETVPIDTTAAILCRVGVTVGRHRSQISISRPLHALPLPIIAANALLGDCCDSRMRCTRV